MKKLKQISIFITLIIVLSILFSYMYPLSMKSIVIKDTKEKIQEYEKDSNLIINDIVISFKNNQISQKSTAVFKDINGWNVRSGKWKIINGIQLEGKNSNPIESGPGVLADNPISNNSIIEFKINPKDNTQKGWFHFGIIFGLNNNSYYVARYYSDKRGNSNEHNFALGKKISDGTFSWLHTDYDFIFKTSYWYKIKLTVTEEYFLLYIDDLKLFTVKNIESPLNEGRISFGAYESSAIFSDIRITNLTKRPINISFSYSHSPNFPNLTITPDLTEKSNNPSSAYYYPILYSFPSINYTITNSDFALNDSLLLSFPIDLIRPPDIIYFPTEPYNRTFAIRLVAKGWDEQKQEWVFKEFMSPEFTWEDVVEGRTITAGGNSTG